MRQRPPHPLLHRLVCHAPTVARGITIKVVPTYLLKSPDRIPQRERCLNNLSHHARAGMEVIVAVESPNARIVYNEGEDEQFEFLGDDGVTLERDVRGVILYGFSEVFKERRFLARHF